MTRMALVLMLVAGSAAGAVSIGSALFTDTVNTGDSLFTAGSVILTTSPVSTTVTFPNMAPGDAVTAPITVNNTGTLQYRYAVTSVVTDTLGLAAQLVMKIRTGVTTCDNADFASSGTQVYTGTLGSTSGTNNVIGDPAQGAQTGDSILAPAGTQVLCFNVALPSATGNAFQTGTATATFSFVAEQTANNP